MKWLTDEQLRRAWSHMSTERIKAMGFLDGPGRDVARVNEGRRRILEIRRREEATPMSDSWKTRKGVAAIVEPSAWDDARWGKQNLVLRDTYRNDSLKKADEILAFVRAQAALSAPAPQGIGRGALRPMSEAPKDRTPILARTHDDIYPRIHPGREDLDRWNGLWVVIHHPGLADDGFDLGWSVSAPVGVGLGQDDWFAGWQPLPEPPAQGER